MKNTLEKLLDYKQTDPTFVSLAFEYADKYSEGLFNRGVFYGTIFGVIVTLAVIALYITLK